MSKTIAKRTRAAATRKSAAKKSAARKAQVKKAAAKKKSVKNSAARKAATRRASTAPAVRKSASRKPRPTAKGKAIASLQQVKGIGQAYAERLYKAGIKSLEALAGLRKKEADKLAQKLGLGQRIHNEKWTAQAKKLVRQQAKKTARAKTSKTRKTAKARKH